MMRLPTSTGAPVMPPNASWRASAFQICVPASIDGVDVAARVAEDERHLAVLPSSPYESDERSGAPASYAHFTHALRAYRARNSAVGAGA